MHVLYCKKCKINSASAVCSQCGARLDSPQNERYIWHYSRLPLGDAPTLMGAVRALAITVIALLLVMFVGELIFSPDKRAALTMFSTSGLVPSVLIFFFLALGAMALFLGLRGREELYYILDQKGARLQIWIDPSRVKCWARFLAYEPYKAKPDPEGIQRIMIAETQLLWNDVQRVEIRRRASRIDLYRPASFRFMSLYPDPDELDEIENYIIPRMKYLSKK